MSWELSHMTNFISHPRPAAFAGKSSARVSKQPQKNRAEVERAGSRVERGGARGWFAWYLQRGRHKQVADEVTRTPGGDISAAGDWAEEVLSLARSQAPQGAGADPAKLVLTNTS